MMQHVYVRVVAAHVHERWELDGVGHGAIRASLLPKYCPVLLSATQHHRAATNTTWPAPLALSGGFRLTMLAGTKLEGNWYLRSRHDLM